MVRLKKISGKSLIEVLIALVIISSVMLVFSSVFLQVSKPSVYRQQIEQEQVYLSYLNSLTKLTNYNQNFVYNGKSWETKATLINDNLYAVEFFVNNSFVFSKTIYIEND